MRIYLLGVARIVRAQWLVGIGDRWASLLYLRWLTILLRLKLRLIHKKQLLIIAAFFSIILLAVLVSDTKFIDRCHFTLFILRATLTVLLSTQFIQVFDVVVGLIVETLIDNIAISFKFAILMKLPIISTFASLFILKTLFSLFLMAQNLIFTVNEIAANVAKTGL